MLSIVVAIHNQLGHNILFLEGIRRYTTGAYEVIVIDNHSTDGSREYFEQQHCRVIHNPVNLCYPESMNAGVRVAKGDFLCLINNDLYVGPNWDGLLIEAMEHHCLDVASPLGIELMPTVELTGWIYHRWAAIGRGRLSSGKDVKTLRKYIRAMYGDWEAFCREVAHSFQGQIFEGIVGSCVMVRRSLLDKMGLFDERVQAHDWDFYLSVRKREEEIGDVRRSMVIGGPFVHHFIRATVKGRREPFACTHPRLGIKDKWTMAELARLWFKPEDLPTFERPFSMNDTFRRRVRKPLKKLLREVNRALAWPWFVPQPKRILNLYRHQFLAAQEHLRREERP